MALVHNGWLHSIENLLMHNPDQQLLPHREAVHLRGQEPPASKKQGRPRDMTKKAVLLSGPPGIGKTSSALILAKCASLLGSALHTHHR